MGYRRFTGRGVTMRITPHLAIVASGSLGFYQTDAYDCNVYLIDCGDQLVLIDSGAGRDIDSLLTNIQADGYDPGAIRHLLLTHAHADHAGGCAELHRRLGLSVWGSAETSEWVANADEQAISLDRARLAGGYPPDYRFQACPISGVVHDQQPLTFGTAQFLPLTTPGHANGHLVYLATIDGIRAAFVGDLVLCGGEVLLQHTYDCSPLKLGDSLLRLAAYQIDALFPGHRYFCLKQGNTHLERAASFINRLRLPPNAS